jgi:hypothetical protein
MAGQGTKILAIDYNDIQTKVSRVLGKNTNDGDYGYGQTVLSTPVDVTKTVTVEQWTNLRTDLLKARQHQTGVSEVANLGTIPASDVAVKESTRAAYLTMANNIDADRLITPPSGTGVALPQAEELDAYLPQRSRTANWNGTVEHTVTATFQSQEAARYFFNAGGEFRFSATRTGGTAAKDLSWSTLLDTMKTIRFNHTRCWAPDDPDTNPPSYGTSYNTNTGYYDLTTNFVTVYTKKAVGSYAVNYFTLLARVTTTDRNVVQFVLRFVDQDTANNPTPGSVAPWHIDEDVTGKLSTTVKILHPIAANGGVTTAIPYCDPTDIG